MISVVIPALNEGRCIERTLAAIPPDAEPVEILVVDGGSTDDTCERAAPLARILSAPRGRARQMNAGAAAARGDVLLFLHADTLLPEGAPAAVRQVLSESRVEAGAFRLRFDTTSPLLRFYSFCTRFPLPILCFGDRGLFVRRSTFEALGGFPDIPLFEDLEMVRRLARRGGFRFLPGYATTSARRFLQDGILRRQLRNAGLWLQYLAGADPEALAGNYRYDAPAGDVDPSGARA